MLYTRSFWGSLLFARSFFIVKEDGMREATDKAAAG